MTIPRYERSPEKIAEQRAEILDGSWKKQRELSLQIPENFFVNPYVK
ncbi:hypothetical protein HYW84_00910 [Candidatus Peregrinibacteria bacterium]|nr:hypothetical protein [Candidatus Peregrinibacteria bacterium]